MRFLIIPLLAVVLFSCTQPAAGQKTLVILGSSTSACYNVDPSTTCYVARLRAFYNQQAGIDTTINNDLPAGGYTVYRAMPTGYVSPYESAPPPPYSATDFQVNTGHNITYALSYYHPDVILVNFPTNAYDVIRVDSVLYCLRTIRDTANKHGVPCYITTTQPRTDANFNNATVKRKLAELKDSILLEFGPFAIDFYTGMFDPADSSIKAVYNSNDNIHFNAAGHDVLAQRVEAANVFNAVSLPATFLQFNAMPNGGSNLVSWSVSKETDVARYDIQRSADGILFHRLGSLDPNNSPGVFNYQYADAQPIRGWSYYKVTIVDRDGKTQSSPIFKAFNGDGRLAVAKLMNQASQVLLELQNGNTQYVTVQVFNSAGLLVQQSKRYVPGGGSTLAILTGALSSGVYYIKLVSAGASPIITPFIKN